MDEDHKSERSSKTTERNGTGLYKKTGERIKASFFVVEQHHKATKWYIFSKKLITGTTLF